MERITNHIFLHCAVVQKLWSMIPLLVWCFQGNAIFCDGDVITLDRAFWQRVMRGLESCYFVP